MKVIGLHNSLSLQDPGVLTQLSEKLLWSVNFYCLTLEFFIIGLYDAFLSDYLTDLKINNTNEILSKFALSEV